MSPASAPRTGRPRSATTANHGTMVASLLAGRGTGDGNGVIGIAPEADLLTASVAFGQDTGAEKSNDDQIAEAVRWAVDNGADVINMSLTRNTRDWPESWDDAFMYAFENDVVVVAAAGNRGSGTSEVGAPATIPGVLTVAGVDREKNASFDASSQGITIAVAAPSEDLVGVLPDGSVRAVERHERGGADRVGPRRAHPQRVSRPRCGQRHRTTHSHGRSERARGAESAVRVGLIDPVVRARPPRCPRSSRARWEALRSGSRSTAERMPRLRRPTRRPRRSCRSRTLRCPVRTARRRSCRPRGRSPTSRSRSRSSPDLVR